jgi:hypothetical protein
MIADGVRVKNPAASCGASSKEKTFWGLLPPNPRWPFLPAANWGLRQAVGSITWLFPVNNQVL